MVSRHFHSIYQVVILYQLALAFHQLVDQNRGYGVFACARESVDPDERGGLDLVGHGLVDVTEDWMNFTECAARSTLELWRNTCHSFAD